MGIVFGSLLQMQEIEIDSFFALLLSNFNPNLPRLKVDGNRHILITEFDVEEIFSLWSQCSVDG